MKNIESKVQAIGRQIRVAREAEGFSQSDLAKQLGFGSATAVSLIESGERKITIENLEKIAGILHRDIYFFLGKDSKYTPTIQMALRADKNISSQAKKIIEDVLKIDKNTKKDGRN